MRTGKHFLDTSVLRPVLLGSAVYKQYYSNQLRNGRKYVSKYVIMEFRRSYIRKILNFYFVLDMPYMETVGDAMTFWSNAYKTSDLKAILQFVAQIITSFKLIEDNPKDKQKSLKEIGRYVKRLEMKLRRQFIDTGKNETQCYRAKIPFQYNDNLTLMFKDFLRKFDDVQLCRSKCVIDSFFHSKYKKIVERFIKYANQMSNPNNIENRGFKKIVENLNEATKDNGKFSCHFCEKIGDSVIALECPRDMRLEHSDHSFDHFCLIVSQHHFKHPSESAFLKEPNK